MRILLLVLALSGVGCSCGDDEAPGREDAAVMDATVDGASSTMDSGPRVDSGPPEMDAGWDAGPPPPRCETGDTYTYVMSVIDVGTADPAGDPMIVPGFDIDGRVSDRTDAQGCRHPDFTSPPPDSIVGVDNQMGPVLASLMSTIDVSAELRTAVSSGQLLFLARVSGVDDFADDDCIDLEVLIGLLPVGVTMPMLDAAGELTPDQTFDIDLRSVGMDGMTPLVRFPRGRIVAGRVQAASVTPFTLDIPTGGTSLTITARQPQTRFDITATSIGTGVLGGALDVNQTVTAVGRVDPTIPIGLVRAILGTEADLSPSMAGVCREISIGFVFDGVPAVEGAIR